MQINFDNLETQVVNGMKGVTRSAFAACSGCGQQDHAQRAGPRCIYRPPYPRNQQRSHVFFCPAPVRCCMTGSGSGGSRHLATIAPKVTATAFVNDGTEDLATFRRGAGARKEITSDRKGAYL